MGTESNSKGLRKAIFDFLKAQDFPAVLQNLLLLNMSSLETFQRGMYVCKHLLKPIYSILAYFKLFFNLFIMSEMTIY